MKFLLNMNMSRSLGKQLAIKGHTYRHVGDIGLANANDITIIEEARANEEVIITHDLDYGHLLAFSGESIPSVVIFRLCNMQLSNILNRIVNIFSDIERALSEGAVILVEDAALRIRALPIVKEG